MVKKGSQRSVSRAMLITIGAVAFLCGIGLVAAGLHIYEWWIGLAAVCLVGCLKKKILFAVPSVVAAGLIAGLWRGSDEARQVAGYASFFGQVVNITGDVVEDPTYDGPQQVMLLEHIHLNEHPLPGTVRVKSITPIEPKRGDHLLAKGKLMNGFANYQAALYFADTKIMAVAQSSIDALRRAFAARIYNLLPDTQAGLGLGFLLGIKSSLPESLNNELKTLGLTHIVVASGYNLTVLVRLARRIFARSSHFQASMASMLMIAGFVAITGFSPSMSRAALVASLSVWAAHYGRHIHQALLISLAAAVTAAINPLYVWSDIGWWLSFLAFAGVMLLAPLLQRRIFGKREPKLIGQVVLETISAELLTLPLITLIFGNFSVLSLLANVLVVPLIPLAMLLTFTAGAIGWLVPFAAWPAIWLLGYICELVHLLARISWASIPVVISPPIFIVSCVGVLALGLLLRHTTKHDYLEVSVIE